ncbi:autotransporter outer membrane beta-barrel domain-containing protein [Brucella pituitosa]|uniref:autotransporter outer membrane beta-barrel domain-containing protein n=1 Tax=Brucella pituitosa TaxID=571256 RepID=UPI0013747158|nr:autotransporter outer membrane beta-barrel domain-containing protein [Brucella pituitosa]
MAPHLLVVSLSSILAANSAFSASLYWDPNGATTGRGGAGIWNLTSPFWSATADGLTGPYSAWNNAAHDNAIFGGTAGTVTLANPITIGGLQFSSNGYVLSGNQLTLGDAYTVLSVGEGTPADAAMTATISAVIAGDGQLVKSGAGILVLNATNTYTGGTLINGGTLRISSDANLGNASGALSLDGGTLNTTASMTSARAVSLTGVGSFAINASTVLTLSGPISGSGSLSKTAAGTLILAGSASYSGGTTIAAGTLQVGNGGVSGNVSGDIANNGALVFNRSDNLSYSGSVSGTGTLTQSGSGRLSLTGNNTYSGATTVDRGALMLEAGGRTAGTSVLMLRNSGELIVDGPATRFATAGTATSQIGAAGSGFLTVSNGGSASFGAFDMAYAANSSGTMLVTGAGSQVAIAGTSVLGRFGTATINVLNGGKLISTGTSPLVGGQLATGNGTVVISGTGSQWSIVQGLQLRRGTVSVRDGGHIAAGAVTIGYVGAGLNAPDAALLVTGEGSLIETTGAFAITNSAASGNKGVVTLSDGAVIRVGSGVLAMGPGNATFNIGGVVGGTAQHAGTLDAASLTMAAAGNRINFNHDDANYRFSATISGAGSLAQNGPGTTVLTGANSYQGATTVDSGSLYINGDQSLATGVTTVASSATLGGSGTIGGDVNISGILDPGDVATHAGTLTINGNLVLAPGATLAMELGEDGMAGGALNDLVVVKGDLTLDGTLNVTEAAGGNYGPGLYRMLSYTGNLTDNGLAIGNLPRGSAMIQTAMAQQVNLIAGGADFDFWDGAAGAKFDGLIEGGDGVWQNNAGNTNWTEYSGNINASYRDGSLAIFGGHAGTVVVDNSLGTVAVKALQFATDNYVITGDVLTMVAPQSTFRVGDGTAAGAAITATIRNQLAGDAQLVKTDLGVLVLAGDNTYSGGTRISAGTLRISADNNLGAAKGALIFEGGSLNATASISSERSVEFVGSGNFNTDPDTRLVLNGVMSGTGSFTKTGAGELVLEGEMHAYSGHAAISEGTLVASGQFPGSIEIGSAGRLEGTGTVGTTKNAGIIAPGRHGIGTLTIDGDYSSVAGTLDITTELGDDNSPTSRLVVTGNTAGDTKLSISNRGGLGAQTVNGIKIIDVGGQSDGRFTLNGDYTTKDGQQAIMTASAYAYTLQKGSGQNGSGQNGAPWQGSVQASGSANTDGNWYLVSQNTKAPDPSDPVDPTCEETNSCPPPQPGPPRYSAAAPIYQSYLANLKALNQLPTLTQRVGDRYLDGAIQARTAANAAAGETTPSGIWGRIEGAHNRIQSTATAGDLNQNINTVILQAGLDGQFYENDKGRVIAGLTGQYGNAHSNIDNRTGDGSGTIDTQAWGLGANATFYGNNGFYLDAQAQANWYDSDLDVDAVNRGLAHSNKGFGYALSLEAGQHVTLDENWSLTPQAQLMWSTVDFDSFTDSYGARISSHEGDNLNARLGLAANYQNSFTGADGRKVDTALYGIANLYQSLIGNNRINYAGTRMASDDDRSWAGIGLGGTYAWADNKYALYGEGSVNTSLNHFADSYTIKGNLGFKVKW